MEEERIIISEDQLRDLFTYSMRDLKKIWEELKVDPYETMSDIGKKYTDNPSKLNKADAVTKILYFVENAYKMGYMKAAVEINELNKTIIKNLMKDY